MQPQLAPRGPWRSVELTGLVVVNGFGLLIAILAWQRAASAVRPADQSDDAVLAIVGLALAGFANASWLTVARRRVHRQIRLAGGAFRHALDGRVDVPRRSPTGDRGRNLAGLPSGATLVAGTEMSMYHTPSCPLVAGKAVAAQSMAGHRQAGRRPCGVCQP